MPALRRTFNTIRPAGFLFIILACLTTACAPAIPPATPTPTLVPATSTTAATATPAATAAATPVPFGTLVHLFDYDASAPLDIQETRVFSLGVTIHDITYANPKGGRIGAWLATPSGSGPFAAVLFQVGYKTAREQFLGEAIALAKMGVVGLLYDSQYTPEGMPANHDQIIRAIVNLRRGVDLLIARPDVDKSRMGFVGQGDGASLGAVLASVEKRVAAYVLMSGWGGFFGDEQDGGIQYVGHAAPASLFFQNGLQDQTVPKDFVMAFQNAGSEPKLIKWYDADYTLNNAAQSDRAQWLSTQLKLPKRP